jgi:hypothetical protein
MTSALHSKTPEQQVTKKSNFVTCSVWIWHAVFTLSEVYTYELRISGKKFFRKVPGSKKEKLSDQYTLKGDKDMGYEYHLVFLE